MNKMTWAWWRLLRALSAVLSGGLQLVCARSCRRVWLRLGVGAAGAALLGGCTTAYQRMGYTGGYSEVQLSTDVYRVTFAGNGHTPKDMVERFFMYRCAELTKEKGYKYFTVLRNGETGQLEQPDRRLGLWDPKAARPAAYVPAPDEAPGAGGYRKVRGSSGGGYYYVPGGTYYITTWTGRATIRLLNDMGIHGRVVGYVAEDVLRQLGPYVQDQTHMVKVDLPGPVLIDSTYGVRPLRPAPEAAVPPAPPATATGPSAADLLRGNTEAPPAPPTAPAGRPDYPPGGARMPPSNPTDKAI